MLKESGTWLCWPIIMRDKNPVAGCFHSSTRAIYEKDTKTHQARRIALDAGTVAALRAWREECDRRAALCRVAVLPDGYVFSAQPDGSEPWRPYRWTSAWRRLRDRAGIDKSVRLHDLRHFTATRLLDAGVPVKTVSGRLGHARPATTLNITTEQAASLGSWAPVAATGGAMSADQHPAHDAEDQARPRPARG